MSDLLKWCNTKRQENIILAIQKYGNQHRAAIELGIDGSNLRKTYKAIKARAEKESLANFGVDDSIPIGFSIKGVSTYKEDSNGNRHWLKIDKDKKQQEEAIRDYVEGLTTDLDPAKPAKIAKAIKHDPDLMTGIFIGDAHVGMYAYGKETKHSDFDSDIATVQIRAAVDDLVSKALPTETGMLINVGDLIHMNSQNNQTYSGTALDTDTRYSRILFMAGMTMRYCIDRMLTKFKKVIVVNAKGNHDTDSAVAINLALQFYYSKENRVAVLETDSFYHYIEYGKWLLGVTHGDKQKPESLAGSMARDMPEAWGRTISRMWCAGHLHKDQVKSLPGVKYKVFGALAPPDGWHASHGFLGDGEMEMITFRKSGGIHSTAVYHLPQPRKEPDVTI